MKLALGPYIRFSRILLFPLAMVIYDFSAYLTTDLIQPGIIHIIREFEADVALAPASVSLYLAGGLALQWLLGHVKAGRNEQGASWGTFNGNHTCGLCVGVPFDQQPAGVGNGTMVALNARSVAHIAELHALAL